MVKHQGQEQSYKTLINLKTTEITGLVENKENKKRICTGKRKIINIYRIC